MENSLTLQAFVNQLNTSMADTLLRALLKRKDLRAIHAAPSNHAEWVKQFLADECVIEAESFATITEIWDRWSDWATEHKVKVGTKIGFGKRLAGLVPDLHRAYRGPRGSRVWVHEGLSLRPRVRTGNA